MALSKSVEKVLRMVEEKSGLPVHVEPDPALPKNELAKVTMARREMPFHRVALQPNATKPDYLIAFQCGFILRRCAVPPEAQLDFAAADAAEATVRQWVAGNPKTPNQPEHTAKVLTEFLCNGLLSQLRSTPVGLRVDSWILEEFPDLADLQQQALTKQLNDNAAALRPEVQAMMPDQALAANIGMNAAFALFWADKVNQSQIVLPYKATGHLATGQALLDLWHGVPADPARDTGLIDAWARLLGLGHWYQWIKPSNP